MSEIVQNLMSVLELTPINVGRAILIHTESGTVSKSNVPLERKPARYRFNMFQKSHYFSWTEVLQLVYDMMSKQFPLIGNGVMRSKDDDKFINDDLFPFVIVYRHDEQNYSVSGKSGKAFDKSVITNYLLSKEDMHDFIQAGSDVFIEVSNMEELLTKHAIDEELEIYIDVQDHLNLVGNARIVNENGVAKVSVYFADPMLRQLKDDYSLRYTNNKLLLNKK